MNLKLSDNELESLISRYVRFRYDKITYQEFANELQPKQQQLNRPIDRTN